MASDAVSMSEARGPAKLDYSVASLAIVEEMLGESAAYTDEMTPARIDLLVQVFGCYIIEVARREFDGACYWFKQRDQPILVVGEPKFRVSLLTWDRVRSRLAGDPADNIPFFYAGFAERARLAKPGTIAMYV